MSVFADIRYIGIFIHETLTIFEVYICMYMHICMHSRKHIHIHTHTYRYIGISRGETLANMEQWREMRALETQRLQRIDALKRIKHPEYYEEMDEGNQDKDPVQTSSKKGGKWPATGLMMPRVQGLGLDDEDDDGDDDDGPRPGRVYR